MKKMELFRDFELALQPSPFKGKQKNNTLNAPKTCSSLVVPDFKRRKLWPERAPTRRVGKWASQTVFLWQGDQRQHDTLACHVNPIGLPRAVFSHTSELAWRRKCYCKNVEIFQLIGPRELKKTKSDYWLFFFF
jgi:hypothetical protein